MVTYQHPGSNSSPQAVGEAEQLVPQPPQPTPNANVKEMLMQFRHHWLQYSQHRFSLLFLHCFFFFFLLPAKVSVVLTDAEMGSCWAVGYDKHQLQPLLMTPSCEKHWDFHLSGRILKTDVCSFLTTRVIGPTRVSAERRQESRDLSLHERGD